jgi:hypothetical protein
VDSVEVPFSQPDRILLKKLNSSFITKFLTASVNVRSDLESSRKPEIIGKFTLFVTVSALDFLQFCRTY